MTVHAHATDPILCNPEWLAVPYLQEATRRDAVRVLRRMGMAHDRTYGDVVLDEATVECQVAPVWNVDTLDDHGHPIMQLHGEPMARMCLLELAEGPLPAPVMVHVVYVGQYRTVPRGAPRL